MKDFHFNILVLLAGFCFLFLTGKPAVAGSFMNGECWPSLDLALSSFVSNFPKTDGQYLYSVSSSQVFGSQIQYVMTSTNQLDLTAFSHVVNADVSFCNDALAVSPVIDAANITFAFGWGFAAVILFWFLGYVIALGLMVINKI